MNAALPMKILALEFSSAQRSAAVLQAATGARQVLSEVIETGGRSTKALGMIEAALAQAQLEREQVECIAVGLGPGSYTGIRAAIAVAQGWQIAREIKLIGISSAEAVVAELVSGALFARVGVVIDAQRNEFYLGEYETASAGWRELAPVRLATAEEVRQSAEAGFTLVGPEVTRWFPNGQERFPRAAEVARLAAGRSDFTSGDKLQPIYLRQTQFVKAPAPRSIP